MNALTTQRARAHPLTAVGTTFTVEFVAGRAGR
jgi:hypothetical protein